MNTIQKFGQKQKRFLQSAESEKSHNMLVKKMSRRERRDRYLLTHP